MPAGWADVQPQLFADPDVRVQKLAINLAVNFRVLAAARRALAVVVDPKQPSAVRADAIRTLGPMQLPEAKPVFLQMIAEPGEIGIEALRALAGYDGKEIPTAVLSHWKTLPAGERTEAITLLASRKAWAVDLLKAVAAGTVEKTSLNANTVLRLRAFKDAKLNAEIERVWGKVRDTPAELNALSSTKCAASSRLARRHSTTASSSSTINAGEVPQIRGPRAFGRSGVGRRRPRHRIFAD